MREHDFRWSSFAIASAAFAGLSCALAGPASAAPRGSMSEAGLGLGSIAASLIYTPAKLVYAGSGALIGVGAFAASGGRKDVFWEIVRPSLGGDYVVTPEHLLRERRLAFMGAPPVREGDDAGDFEARDRYEDDRYDRDRDRNDHGRSYDADAR
jgi:hypothetical protein